VYPGGGAAAAGVVPGDRIASIDGTPVADLGEAGAVARIRGVPNTTLALGVRRAGGVVTLVITRARIEV
jgi:C-terminal processing protease CtpA/Prc